MDKPISISAIAFPENGHWVVQGIEYDICTHAKDPAGVPAAFTRAVVENCCISRHLGREPFQGLPAAPRRFKEMFDEAVAKVSPVRELPHPDIPIPAVDIRLAEHA
jgi:hypothetical protein